jgi:branched-subunit amino acid transport protein
MLFANPHKFPHAFRVALVFVPPAVLAAIVAPGLFVVEEALDFGLDNPRWIAGLAALAVAARTRNAVATIAVGMSVLWLLQWTLR